MTIQPAFSHDAPSSREAPARPGAEGGRGPRRLDAEQAGAGREVGAGLSIQLAEDLAGMEALAAEWRALEDAWARDIHAFQSHAWCRAWVETCMDAEREKPFVIAVRRGGRLVLLWPLMIARRGPLRVLRWLSDPYSQYGDALSALEGEALSRALEAAWGFILEKSRADIVRLRHVRDDANVADFLKRRFRPAGDADGAPWLDLRQFADEAAYDRRYSKTQRRRRKRIRKALEEEAGPLEFSLLEGGGELREAIALALAEKRAWLAEKGLYSRPLANPRLEDFLAALPAGPGAEGTRLALSRLAGARRAVSWEIGFRYKGRHYGYITAHDRTLTRRSPGRLHMDLSQRRALRDGAEVFDLLVPVAPHKESWSSAIMPTFDYYRPLTLAGRVFGEGYLRIGRPLLRRLYRSAPPGLRRALGLGRAGAGEDPGAA